MIGEEQIEHFYREGYVVVRGLAPADVVAGIVNVAETKVRTGDQWQPTIFDHDHPEKDAAVHQLLWQPRVIEVVEQLLGSEPRVYYGMLAVVPAKGGKGLPWHQDNQYEQILGGALNTFVALCDITSEKANLWVAPRSHRLGLQPSKVSTTAPGHREAVTEPENGIPLPALNTGDACIFDRSTYHRSLRNETDQPRFAYAAQYQADHARLAATGRRKEGVMRARDLAARVAAL